MNEETRILFDWLAAHPLSLEWGRAIARDRGEAVLREWVYRFAPVATAEGDSAYGRLLGTALGRVDYSQLAAGLAAGPEG